MKRWAADRAFQIPNSEFQISLRSSSGLFHHRPRPHAPPRLDQQPQGEPVRRRVRFWRDAIYGRQHATLTQAPRDALGLTDVAFELQMHKAVQRDRHRPLALDVDPELTDVFRRHTYKSRRPVLIFPGETGRQRHRPAVGASLVHGLIGGFHRLGGPDVLHGVSPDSWRRDDAAPVTFKGYAYCRVVQPTSCDTRLTCSIK